MYIQTLYLYIVYSYKNKAKIKNEYTYTVELRVLHNIIIPRQMIVEFANHSFCIREQMINKLRYR